MASLDHFQGLVCHLRVEYTHREELDRHFVLRHARVYVLLLRPHFDVEYRLLVEIRFSLLGPHGKALVVKADKLFLPAGPHDAEGTRRVIKLPDALDHAVDQA